MGMRGLWVSEPVAIRGGGLWVSGSVWVSGVVVAIKGRVEFVGIGEGPCGY